MNAALLSSEKMDWCTPEHVLKRVRRVASIALDPCAGRESIVNAKMNWYGTASGDGLSQDWSVAVPDGEIAYVNPPYGRVIGEWIAKCALEWIEHRVESIALVPARVDTIWWHAGVVAAATSVCCWRGRLTFLGASSGAPFPSALIYYGARPERFEEAFRGAGWIVRLK